MEDIIGNIYGDYKVVELLGKLNPKRRTNYYKLKCMICGEERISPKTTKDGFDGSYKHSDKVCVNYFRNKYIGEIFGDYKVISFECVKNNKKIYKVECQKCKRVKSVNLKHLINGKGITHQSCVNTIGDIDKRFYNIWADMRKRTTNPNSIHFCNYGGRGIKSDEYELFIDFYDDMYDSYKDHVLKFGEEDTTLDRIDVNKNYVKSNLRWATRKTQNRNTRRQSKLYKAISPNGEIYTFNCPAEFAETHGLNKNNIYNTINGYQKTHKNWRFEKI